MQGNSRHDNLSKINICQVTDFFYKNISFSVEQQGWLYTCPGRHSSYLKVVWWELPYIKPTSASTCSYRGRKLLQLLQFHFYSTTSCSIKWTHSNIWVCCLLKILPGLPIYMQSARKHVKFLAYSTADSIIFPMPIPYYNYVSMVRPDLEYACPVWAPHTAKDILELERVQRFAGRMATRNWNLSYSELQSIVNLPSLEED